MSDNAELIDIAGIVSEHPAEALGRLGAINRDSLAERDAYYHDFLTLKANDKAYIDHTTDSIILRLLPYYEGEPLYPEVLYYAGRVYSDLGDYPTSLRYFQEALDHIPSDREHLRLKGHICSQTGRLLNTLRMYDSAIPYLKEVIQTNTELADTFNLAYNYQLLGAIYMHYNQLDSAERCINSASYYAKSLGENVQYFMQMYQAAIQYSKNNMDSSLILIREVPSNVDPLCRNAALNYASNIYLANNIKDTAYVYADELIRSSEFDNIHNGYHNLLSQDLIDMVPTDSMAIYVIRAYNALDKFYNQNNARQGIIQQSMYNYEIHELARLKAERKATVLVIIVISIASIIVILILLLLYRRKTIIANLIRMSRNLEMLSLIKTQENKHIAPTPRNVKALRERLSQTIKQINKENKIEQSAPKTINESKIYSRLIGYLTNKKIIPESDILWEQLEKEILAMHPLMNERIQILSNETLTQFDRNLLLLIKCGFSSSQIGTLLGRSKSTLTYRRNNLNKILFDGCLTPKQLNNAIIAL